MKNWILGCLSAACLMAGCDDDLVYGEPQDAGEVVDSGELDAGTTPTTDASVRRDAGADGGARSDGGAAADAGGIDSGTPPDDDPLGLGDLFGDAGFPGLPDLGDLFGDAGLL